jgi:outer membrane protein assembly factor BamB
VISEDGNLLIAGSEAGAYVLNALDGTSLRSDTAHDVTTMPAFGNSTGTVWFASDETIYGLRSNGTECTYDEVLDQISSPLALNGDESVLFFGTDLGSFFALDASSSASGCSLLASEDLLLKRTILGLDLVSDGADAVIYVTSSFGELARIEYDDGRGFQDKKEPTNASGPREIGASPAVLPNASGRDADVVFITGRTRDGRVDRPILQGWERDLKDYETVSVWSTSIPFLFKPKEGGVIPDALLTPIIDADTFTLLVSSSDGYLYAFDLSQFE